jgi:hypothetical protein
MIRLGSSLSMPGGSGAQYLQLFGYALKITIKFYLFRSSIFNISTAIRIHRNLMATGPSCRENFNVISYFPNKLQHDIESNNPFPCMAVSAIVGPSGVPMHTDNKPKVSVPVRSQHSKAQTPLTHWFTCLEYHIITGRRGAQESTAASLYIS